MKELIESDAPNKEDVQPSERVRIGARIRELRQEAHMTGKELAERADITFQSLSKIEAGKFSVGIDILSRIASGLGKKVDFI